MVMLKALYIHSPQLVHSLEIQACLKSPKQQELKKDLRNPHQITERQRWLWEVIWRGRQKSELLLCSLERSQKLPPLEVRIQLISKFWLQVIHNTYYMYCNVHFFVLTAWLVCDSLCYRHGMIPANCYCTVYMQLLKFD